MGEGLVLLKPEDGYKRESGSGARENQGLGAPKRGRKKSFQPKSPIATRGLPCDPKKMKTLSALSLAALTLSACTKTPSQETLKQEFAQLCATQKDFLAARALKGVNEAELLVERNKKMRAGATAAQTQKVVELIAQPEPKNVSAEATRLAVEAGVEGWACPELDQGP